jgi:hypothetical protein
MLRILRGLGGRALPCGCLVGFYETYANETVAILDAKDANCSDDTHQVDAAVDVPVTELRAQPPSTMPTVSR